MKRKDLERQINDIAKRNGFVARWSEGANHSKVQVGKAQTTVPRHTEINDLTAKSILRYIKRMMK